jgi:hypothetical protein
MASSAKIILSNCLKELISFYVRLFLVFYVSFYNSLVKFFNKIKNKCCFYFVILTQNRHSFRVIYYDSIYTIRALLLL